jgi:hypothetical protein
VKEGPLRRDAQKQNQTDGKQHELPMGFEEGVEVPIRQSAGKRGKCARPEKNFDDLERM